VPDFAYIARDSTGQRITGTLTAQTEREVLGILSGKALFPVQVTASKTIAPGAKLRVRGQVMATVYSQLSALLRGGVPLLKSLAVLRDQTSNKNLKAILQEVYHRVEDGSTLGDAMARFPRAFNEMAVNMVRAGGEGGFLEDALDRVADFTEQQEDLKGRTVSAMVYPLLLGTAGTLVVTVLVVFFVPKFAVMFERLRERGELPYATELLLWISESSRSPVVLLIVIPALIALGFFLYIKLQTPEGRRAADYLRIKIPIAGPIFLSFAVARFCRVLGTLLHNGVPIL
jgi:general secretion pathway protein F/type IV pilus assembly protein PilC